MAEAGPRQTAGQAQSAAHIAKEPLQKQVLRVHAFLDTVKANRIALDIGSDERLHQGLENIDLYEQTVMDFENRLQNFDPSQGDELEMDWAQKVKAMCDTGLDAVIAVMKRATTGSKMD